MKRLFTLIALTITSAIAEQKKPNIIVIMADDMGYECVGANGSESYKTPHLDKMAKEGVRFTNFYANPICTPSRCKIMTGMSNVRNYVKFGVLDRKQKTFAHYLKDAGYKTCIAGKWQLGSEADAAQHFGFEQSLLWQHTRKRIREGTTFDSRHVNPRLEHNGKPKDYDNGEYGPDLCIDFINDFITTNKSDPFFVYYPMILPHCPFVPTPGSPDYDPKSKGWPSYKGEPKYFKDMVEHIDKIMGKLRAHLEKEGLSDYTFILFTCDNGTDRPVKTRWNGKEVAAGKGSMTDNGFRVPCIVNFPGKVKANSVTTSPAALSDILPTICELADLKVPTDTDGASLLPLLKGQSREKDYAYLFYEPKACSLEKAIIVARTSTHELKRKGKNGKLILSRCATPYEVEEIPNAKHSEEDKKAFAKLKLLIESKDKLDNSGLKDR